MTLPRDEIVRMAREASAIGDASELSGDAILCFAALCYEAGAKAEREKMEATIQARIDYEAKAMAHYAYDRVAYDYYGHKFTAMVELRDAIRARGE